MRKAKENVEKHYAVVGVLEELNKTLTVLEHYVPRFFKGAKDVYWSKWDKIYQDYILMTLCFSDEIQKVSKINQTNNSRSHQRNSQKEFHRRT